MLCFLFLSPKICQLYIRFGGGKLGFLLVGFSAISGDFFVFKFVDGCILNTVFLVFVWMFEDCYYHFLDFGF